MPRELEVGGRRFLSLGWSDVEGAVRELSRLISGSYRFESLMGILRGGLVVAVLLSDILGVGEVYPLGMRSYTSVGRRGEVVVYHQPARVEIEGRRVLLVDDVSDEGETLRVALERVLGGLGPSEVKTATLHVKPWTRHVPDYYVQATSSWILYPWSRYESGGQVGRELLHAMERGEAAKTLSDLLGISYEEAEALITGA